MISYPNFTQKVAVVGAGPTGLSSIISYCLTHKDFHNTKFIVFEQNDKICQSILATGNGRCNFTNAQINDKKALGTHVYNNQVFVNSVFKNADCVATKINMCTGSLQNFEELSKTNNEEISKTNLDTTSKTNIQATSKENAGDESAASSVCSSPNSVEKFLSSLGVQSTQEKYGMLFPATKKASTIRNCLLSSMPEDCVKFVTSSKVIEVLKDGDEFFVNVQHTNTNNTKQYGPFSKVIICSGKVDEISHKQIPFSTVTETPILAPLKTKESFKPLDGIRTQVEISLKADSDYKEKGELLFRKYGISGIVVFNLSRQLDFSNLNKDKNKQHKISIDFLPDYSNQQIKNLIQDKISLMLDLNPKFAYNPQVILSGILLENITKYVCNKLNINDLSNAKQIEKLIKILKCFEVTPTDIYSKVPAQVTRGGVSTKDIDPASLALKQDPNVLVGGEAVDIDGPCGGYNLHWAFASGMVIGASLSDS